MPKTSGIVLLMTFRGRSSRLLWWLGHVGAVAAVAAADTAYDMTGTQAAAIIANGVFGLAVYLHCTLTATRLRDRRLPALVVPNHVVPAAALAGGAVAVRGDVGDRAGNPVGLRDRTPAAQVAHPADTTRRVAI